MSNDEQLAPILREILAELCKMNVRALTASSGGGAELASDADLDSQYGDPEVKRDPKQWAGESMVGRRFSQCPPDYLETLAGFKDWQARKDDESGAVDDKGRPKSHWAKKDAARARGWGKRVRDGWTPSNGAGAAPQPSRYGASGHGASAKHTGSPDDYGAAAGDDIPF